MLKTLLLLTLLFPLASTLAYGVDFKVAVSLTQLNCLISNRYGSVMTRVFSNDGQIDKSGLATMNLVQKNKLKLKAIPYISPQANVGSGADQVDKMYNALTANGIQFDVFYIEVSGVYTSWSSDPVANTQFIEQMIQRAAFYRKDVGIYTSYGDWVMVTNNTKNISPGVYLWYLSIYAPGVTGESQPTFDDFLKFGPFTSDMAMIKQFGTDEVVCGIPVNRDATAF